MSFTRTLRAVGGVALAGALVFASAPLASADVVRNAQWPLKALQADALWKISKGKGVTVAVIDDGVNAQHVDLKGNVLQGKDFIDGGSTAPAAGDNHGTGMASLIAGHGHGPGAADGVMGLAPEAKILPIRDLGASNDGFAASIRYAVDHGASIINISQVTSSQNAASAVTYALQHDVLVVTGAGNDATGPDRPLYPAYYPGVVAVGTVDNSGEIWGNSNYGAPFLLTAPGTNVVSASAKSNSSYREASGTSDSTALVSGAAALLRAKFPKLTAGQIVNRLVKASGLPSSVQGISLPDGKYGYGIIRPLEALTEKIPVGSKYGPLVVPQSLKTQSASAQPDGPTSGQDSASSESGSKHTLVVAGLGLGALVVLGLTIFAFVKISRRNKNNGGGPGAPGGYAPTPSYPPYGAQQSAPQHNPYAQPQQNPYQQPTQAFGQWPNQQ